LRGRIGRNKSVQRIGTFAPVANLVLLATGCGVAGEVDPLTSPSHGGGADRARPPERAPSPSPALIPIWALMEGSSASASHVSVRLWNVLGALLPAEPDRYRSAAFGVAVLSTVFLPELVARPRIRSSRS
jgi:hypothetical protein